MREPCGFGELNVVDEIAMRVKRLTGLARLAIEVDSRQARLARVE